MSLVSPLLRICLVLFLAGIGGMARADDAKPASIGQMSRPDLTRFIEAVTATVGQDSLKMQAAAGRHDCLELLRTANSFVLGDDYLTAALSAPAAAGKEDAALALRARIVQGRVLTFAARVRAEEWLGNCQDFVVPDAQRDDPRYQTPRPVAAGDFADAVSDAHEGALANVAAAAAALKAGKCPAMASAGQAITLYEPYLQKLSSDLGDRPELLGPRVSRRQVDADLKQLIAAEQTLWQRYSSACGPAAPGGPNPTPDQPAPAGR